TDGSYNGVADGKSTTLAGFCNGLGSTISVLANPIVLTGAHPAAPTGFTDTVNYTATASVTPAGSVTPVSAVDTSASAGGSASTTVGLFAGNVTVGLSSSSAGGNRPIAGTYQGSVVVTLTPNLGSPPT